MMKTHSTTASLAYLAVTRGGSNWHREFGEGRGSEADGRCQCYLVFKRNGKLIQEICLELINAVYSLKTNGKKNPEARNAIINCRKSIEMHHSECLPPLVSLCSSVLHTRCIQTKKVTRRGTTMGRHRKNGHVTVAIRWRISDGV